MKTLLSLTLLLTLSLTLPLAAQTDPPPPTPTLGSQLTSLFDLNDTNSLINANEINVTPLFKWDSGTELAGGGLKLDWWITDQQGAFLEYDEFSDRSSFWSYGYQARTVFKGMELSLGVGAKQAQDDPFGEVKLFLSPTFTIPIVKNDSLDFRIAIGADITTGTKPSPFLGFTFRALRF
jgi:hypothetical protein